MLTSLKIRNFKLFDEVEIELGERVVFVGPNNSGKTSALQALALWDFGVKRWLEKRSDRETPEKRPGVTINRRDLIALPAPSANLLWRDLRVREGLREGGKTKTRNILVEVSVDGIREGQPWKCGFEFEYANEESFYCRPLRDEGGSRMGVPRHLGEISFAYLPPMSGLAAREDKLEMGSINVRLGEGRTAEVLRNLCWQVRESPKGGEAWRRIADRMKAMFGVELDEPILIPERSEIGMSFRTAGGIKLDLSAGGRGQQQTLLLLAFMSARPGALLLLDEPDAHLEVLRQREIYRLLAEEAELTGSQILAASHSEVVVNEAADRDVVIAFVGTPHRIDDRGSQVAKALKQIRFDEYYLAEQTGWVLYLEGSTDLSILYQFAERLEHPARHCLREPFVIYVANQPPKARDNFYGLREAKPDLVGVALYDRNERSLPEDPDLVQLAWRRREIENYVCQKETLRRYARSIPMREFPLDANAWSDAMDEAIAEIERALTTLRRPDPWGPDIKASTEFLDEVFHKFYVDKLKLPNLMRKTDYHTLVPYVPDDAIDDEIGEKLDAIVAVAERASPRR